MIEQQKPGRHADDEQRKTQRTQPAQKADETSGKAAHCVPVFFCCLKYASTPDAMPAATFSRYAFDCSDFSSCGFDRKPSSISTDGTSGAFKTAKPAKRCVLARSFTFCSSV